MPTVRTHRSIEPVRAVVTVETSTCNLRLFLTTDQNTKGLENECQSE